MKYKAHKLNSCYYILVYEINSEELKEWCEKNIQSRWEISIRNVSISIFLIFHGKYTIDDVYRIGIPNCTHGVLILITKDIIIIDIDDESIALEFEKLFPEFTKTVCTQTSKGFHYYFKRTEKCNDANMFDGARRMFNENGTVMPIDIKTICKTGTSGVISIPHSKNKKWVREITQYEILPMPDAFVDLYIKATKKTVIQHDKSAKSNYVSKLSTYKDTDTNIQDYMECLSLSRADNYTQWIELGWCLHNISHDLLPVWIDFSMTSSKFVKGSCEELWATMKNQGFTIGTLKYWAKEDDPNLYYDIKFKPRAFRAKILLGTTSDLNIILKHIFNKVLHMAQMKT